MMVIKNNPLQGLVELRGSVERFLSVSLTQIDAPISIEPARAMGGKIPNRPTYFRHICPEKMSEPPSVFSLPSKNPLFHIGAQ